MTNERVVELLECLGWDIETAREAKLAGKEDDYEWEQKVATAKRELDKWDTLFNTGLPINWIDEFGKYVVIEKG